MRIRIGTVASLTVIWGGIASTLPCWADSTPESYTFDRFGTASSLKIPDSDPSGVTDTRYLTSLTSIQSLSVSLEINSQWNGDLYAYLIHGDRFAVLLNRVGRTEASPYGYNDAGFNVTLTSGSWTPDVHTYRMTLAPAPLQPLTGWWQADGRDVNPGEAWDNTPRTATLDAFFGDTVAGEWTLFVSDANSGAQSELVSWGLSVNVVPEPRALELLALGGLGWWFFRRTR